MIRYSHRQTGWVMLAAAGATFAFIALQLTIAPTSFLLIPTFALIVVLALFGSLRVTVSDERIELSFGVGLIRKAIPVSSVRAVARARNPWYYGWGIRGLPNGILYNVSGFHAVELTLDDGRRVRIGTDEPDALVGALSKVVGVAAGSASSDVAVQGSRVASLVLLFVAVIGPAIVVGTVLYAGMRPVRTSIANGVLNINGGSSHATVALRDIKEVSLEPQLPGIARRTNGFSMGGSLRGHFRLDSGEPVQLFVERNHPPFVVIRTGNSRIWVNAAESHGTCALYKSLTGVEACSR